MRRPRHPIPVYEDQDCASISSVEDWLFGLPIQPHLDLYDSCNCARGGSAHPLLRKDSEEDPAIICCRRCQIHCWRHLQELSLNEMQHTPQRRSSPRKHDKSTFSRRKEAKGERHLEEKEKEEQDDVDEDIARTPRSNHEAQLYSALDFRPRPPPFPLDNLAASPTRSTSSSKASLSSTSSRSRSPTKSTKMKDFQLSSLPILRKDFGHPDFPTPQQVKELCRDISSIGEHGESVVPEYFKTRIDMEEQAIRSWQTTSEPFHDSWSEDRVFEWVESVQQSARECSDEDLSEASWNSEVHSRILRMVLEGKWREKGLWYRDVTTAKINDKSLVPQLADVSMASHMVDYCLTLNSEGLQQRTLKKLKARNLPSINQTSAEYIRFNPIAVSIEVKRAANDEDGAMIQLATWVCAQFTLLHRLVPSSTTLHPLVLIVIQGHDWKMMIANDSTEGHPPCILRYLPLGNTHSVLGICKIISSLRRIARHIEEEYLPWFETNVLDGI